ncbi:exo-alpha-sialidase [Trypanosoma cruzi]|nr:exo-alpha-sialidase [Trypanosoma cruzi]
MGDGADFCVVPLHSHKGNTIAVPFATTPLALIPQYPFHDFPRSWESTTALERLPAPHVMRLPPSLETNNLTQNRHKLPPVWSFQHRTGIFRRKALQGQKNLAVFRQRLATVQLRHVNRLFSSFHGNVRPPVRHALRCDSFRPLLPCKTQVL